MSLFSLSSNMHPVFFFSAARLGSVFLRHSATRSLSLRNVDFDIKDLETKVLEVREEDLRRHLETCRVCSERLVLVKDGKAGASRPFCRSLEGVWKDHFSAVTVDSGCQQTSQPGKLFVALADLQNQHCS